MCGDTVFLNGGNLYKARPAAILKKLQSAILYYSYEVVMSSELVLNAVMVLKPSECIHH